RSQDSYQQYVETMPWLCIPWQQAGVRAELAELYGIRGIPTLLLLDSNGHVITMDARTEIAEDPLAQNFPWKPRSVNVLIERHVSKLHDYPAIVLFVGSPENPGVEVDRIGNKELSYASLRIPQLSPYLSHPKIIQVKRR
ncbi:hypothetical protein AMK59_1361, partial [Oryctes borbonicus]